MTTPPLPLRQPLASRHSAQPHQTSERTLEAQPTSTLESKPERQLELEGEARRSHEVTVTWLLSALERRLLREPYLPMSARELARRLLNDREVSGLSLEELSERVRSAVNLDVRARGELSTFMWRPHQAGDLLSLRAWQGVELTLSQADQGELSSQEQRAERVSPQPSMTQPSTTQPSTTQPSTTQPSTTQPSTTQPSTPQPSTPQTSTTQPSTPQPSTPHQAQSHSERAELPTLPTLTSRNPSPLTQAQPSLSVKVMSYPLERELITLLSLIEGRGEGAVRRLKSALRSPLEGELSPELLSDPERWCLARLSGQSQRLALDIWRRSGRLLSPLRCEGALELLEREGLIELSGEGRWRVSARGHQWLAELGASLEASRGEALNPSPRSALPPAEQRSLQQEQAVRRACDAHEGLLSLLSVLIERGPAPFELLTQAWGVSLRRSGRRRSDSWLSEGARSRLLHLQERALVERSGQRWVITELGLSWLRRSGLSAPTRDADDLEQLWALLHQQQQRTRESLRALLLQMDPLAFEGLICELLERMGYHDVQLTERTHDMGVDIVAHIELGISSVREVIQVKRHQRSIHRPTLDALRGSLHRFEAVRGTLISTADFSKGTREAAFERGAAPITLINGDKLIELLMEHELGVHKRSLHVWRVEPERFEQPALSSERWRSSPRQSEPDDDADS